jgi:signal transduction histidine kinase
MLATNRSLELVKSMKDLEFLMFSGGKLEQVELHTVLRKLSNNYDISIKVKGEASILADQAIHSVFENLITNSIKHGGSSDVTISIHSDDEETLIDFIDNGSGIDMRHSEKIFTEGFTTSKRTGSGLGLYLVRKTLERYGASISLQESETGAHFNIRFPITEN